MVNNNNESTKSILLNALRNSNEPISGQTLAEKANLSRVSVWKAVQALQNVGYEITSVSHKGYQLTKDLPDSLFPWEFGIYEPYFRHFQLTTSTMTIAREIAINKNSDNPYNSYGNFNGFPFYIITADEQTDIQTLENSTWKSEKGGLFFTLVSHPSNIHFLSTTNFSTLLLQNIQKSILTTLCNFSTNNYYIKKDDLRNIYYLSPEKKEIKVCGILDEINILGGKINYANFGVGINITNSSRKKILVNFIQNLLSNINKENLL